MVLAVNSLQPSVSLDQLIESQYLETQKRIITLWDTQLDVLEISIKNAFADHAKIKHDLLAIKASVLSHSDDNNSNAIIRIQLKIEKLLLQLFQIKKPDPEDLVKLNNERYKTTLKEIERLLSWFLKRCEPNILRMFNKMMTSRMASIFLYKALLAHAAHHDSPLLVKMVDKERVPFGAECNYQEGVIYIDKDLPWPTQFAYFVFELINVMNWPKAQKVCREVDAKIITNSVEYAKAIEKIEYLGTQIHHRLLDLCIRFDNWDSNLDIYCHNLHSNWQEFDGYWETQLRGKHVQYHQDKFNEYINHL